VAAFNRVIDTVRNSEHRKAQKEHKAVYRGAKYLLLKNRRNLRRRSHRQQLKELLALNEVISTVMILNVIMRINLIAIPKGARFEIILQRPTWSRHHKSGEDRQKSQAT